MNKIVFNLLPKKFVFTMFALITLQQIIVAASTALLGLAGQQLASSEKFIWFLIAFLVCSLLPHGISLILKKIEFQGYFDAYFEFVHLRLINLAGSPAKWQNQSKRESFLTAVGPDAEGYLTAVAFSIFDIYLFALTILLNVLSISLVIDPNFSYVFIASGLVSAGIYFVFSKKVETIIEEEQTIKIDFFGYILKSWDNVFLKNTAVNQLYSRSLIGKYQQTRSNIGKAANYSEGLVFILTLVSSIPVFTLIVYLAFAHRTDSVFLAGLLVTIPKQIMILSNFRAFFGQITNLAAFRTRFKSSWENSDVASNNLESQIQLSHIQINHQLFNNLQEIEGLIKNQNRGRLEVRGKNGSGKSTLLLHLNQILEDSFYLPAAPQLEIGNALGTESTGERVLKHLEFIRVQETPILLLDEWDANLDADNKKLIDSALDLISKQKLIIEVRHQRPSERAPNMRDSVRPDSPTES